MKTLSKKISSTQPLSQLPISLRNLDRSTLRQYFINSWNLYELLFSAVVSEEAFYFRADPLRHPLIFYYGHTAAFYINKLRISGLIKNSINWHYELLFAQGVDPSSADQLELSSFRWPQLDLVKNFRHQVYQHILSFIDTCNINNVIDLHSPLWALVMGVEHDRLHFETSSVLIRQLPLKFLKKPERWSYAPCELPDNKIPRNRFISFDKTTVELGKQQMDYFGWDNEFGYEKKIVPAFEVSKNLVTNREFSEFVRSEGYQDKNHWSEEGWRWRVTQSISHPKFWVKQEDCFAYRAMFNDLNFPNYWPVEVNYHEAQAYCNWLGSNYRIMSELEFRAMTQGIPLTPHQISEQAFNINFIYGSPTPVGYQPSIGPINDLYGNVWQWISTQFYPLNGFDTHPYYLDFSAPYFDEHHVMMLGGSWATSGASALSDYRLWFRRNFYQHCGFRVVRNS